MERLRDIREDRDLKQKDIAQILNVSQQTYSRYETNEISIDKESLIKLAQFYHTSVDYLLELTDERNPYPRKKP
ncbi:dNA-binding helix-turn-helix protein [Mycoplasma sp. CAG:776]|nr:dNA-binding helix-turn-helix protein [Mycoplasma sp. CAG:776]